MAKYKIVAYKRASYCGGRNDNFNPITCKGKIVIPVILQSYVLNLYHTYLLHSGMFRMLEMIHQHF